MVLVALTFRHMHWFLTRSTWTCGSQMDLWGPQTSSRWIGLIFLNLSVIWVLFITLFCNAGFTVILSLKKGSITNKKLKITILECDMVSTRPGCFPSPAQEGTICSFLQLSNWGPSGQIQPTIFTMTDKSLPYSGASYFQWCP